MGFLSRFFLKRAERSFETCLRVIQIDLAEDLCNIYSSQMDHKAARTLAAQVVNFLKGEDIDEIARVSDEPLRSRIMAILPQVRQRAAECMQADRQTREIIVATLRMTSFLNFGKYGRAWFQSPAKMRVEQLLVEYGPEFPEEITLAAYEQLSARYHAVKRNRLEYFKAAEQGDAVAQYNLGVLYHEGHGVPQDDTQALAWWRKAAEQGDAAAQHNLGRLYYDGHGVLQDYTQAALWWRKAAERGDAATQFSLGGLYYSGQGVPQDYAEAYFWYDLAAAGEQDVSASKQVAKYRDETASHLTPADLSREQERARKWIESHGGEARMTRYV
jgi:TPR repeat protein